MVYRVDEDFALGFVAADHVDTMSDEGPMEVFKCQGRGLEGLTVVSNRMPANGVKLRTLGSITTIFPWPVAYFASNNVNGGNQCRRAS